MMILPEGTQVIDASMLVPTTQWPHKFPPHHRLSKAVRRLRIGRNLKAKVLKRTIFLIFVLDDQYGVCRLTSIHGCHVRTKANGWSHIDFRTDYPKDRVAVFAFQFHGKKQTLEQLEDLFAKTHAMISDDSPHWVQPAGVTRGQLRPTHNVFVSEPA